MCLNLAEDATIQIANEDIVCYKVVTKEDVPKIYEYSLKDLHGKPFTGVINDIKCNGKISIVNYAIYFCTDCHLVDGYHCLEKFGYENSWSLDEMVQSIFIDGNDENLMSTSPSLLYATLYRRFPIEIGETYTSKLNKYGNVVGEGLHSFVNYKDAINDGPGVVVKCIIPKGSNYYLGKFNNRDSYASDTLKYVEIIDK